MMNFAAIVLRKVEVCPRKSRAERLVQVYVEKGYFRVSKAKEMC